MTGAEFRAWRARLNLSQTEAGERLGRGRTQIARYDSGAAKIPAVVALACDHLETVIIPAEDAAFLAAL